MTFEKYLSPWEHHLALYFSDFNTHTVLNVALIKYLVLMKSGRWNYETQQSTSFCVTICDDLADMNDPTQQLLAKDYIPSPGLLKVQSRDMITFVKKLCASAF